MLDSGICDCLHVVRTALEDSVSIATMILSTDVVIARTKRYTRKQYILENDTTAVIFLIFFFSDTFKVLQKGNFLKIHVLKLCLYF